jgi:hypothetical protein
MGRGGIEPPTHGFSVRCKKNVSREKGKTCETANTQLTPQLTPKSPKQPKIDTENLPPDLTEIVAVWPKLPEHIKAAIKALVHTHSSKDAEQ